MWERLICTCKRSIIRKVKNPQRKESRPHEASQLRCWVPNSWGQDTWGKEDELAMTHPKSWYQTFWTGQGIGALKGYQADEEPYQESQCQRGLRYLRFLRDPRNSGMRPVELRVCVEVHDLHGRWKGCTRSFNYIALWHGAYLLTCRHLSPPVQHIISISLH